VHIKRPAQSAVKNYFIEKKYVRKKVAKMIGQFTWCG